MRLLSLLKTVHIIYVPILIMENYNIKILKKLRFRNMTSPGIWGTQFKAP